MLRKILIGLAVLIAGLWLGNTSLFLTPDPDASPRLLAHRGAHQIYAAGPPGRDTCTAAPIEDPSHPFLENTLPSMEAAFAAGAQVVELDIHLTPDDVFAVFHDWTVDCRTDGSGQTNEIPFSQLQTLDLGYGYITQSGDTPFRGEALGAMPNLQQVLDAFPDGRFLINFKSDRAAEGRRLAQMLRETPAYANQVFGTYGGARPVAEMTQALPDIPGFDRDRITACLGRYIALGWSGHMPEACRNTLILVPQNVAPYLWGWPTRFEQRFARAGTQLVLVGPYGGSGFTAGVDTADQWADLPDHFGGYVWTNRILEIATLAR
jgi:glycerophosphoryl diester phosphodiesterase